MKLKIEFEKPEGFDKWYSETLAECVAQGIVEKAVRQIHRSTDALTATPIRKTV